MFDKTFANDSSCEEEQKYMMIVWKNFMNNKIHEIDLIDLYKNFYNKKNSMSS